MQTRRQFLRSAVGSVALSVVSGGRRSYGGVQPFDVCIIGSGFAGTFLGLSLIERGFRTAIVEAGGFATRDDPPEGRASLFPIVDEGNLGFRVDDTRTIAVGGTSRRWNGVATRLQTTDFRSRTEYGLFADWPLDASELVPYWLAAEQALGACPAPGGTCPERSYRGPEDLFPGRDLSFVPLTFSSRAGRQQPLRLAEVEVPRFQASSLATLMTERPARRILSDVGVATAIEVTRPDGASEEIRARAFVVAAGVPESARILLASRSERSPAGLGNDHDHVGRYFNVHPRLRVSVPLRAGLTPPVGIHRSWSPGDRLRRQGCGAAHFDVHLGVSSALIMPMIEQEPRPENRFTLGTTPGAHARARLSSSEIDRRTRDAVVGLQRELALTLSGDPLSAGPPTVSFFHPAGVCRMADAPERGVVDRDCRVFGTENVYVVGASVFPTSGSGNPTLTIVALALRLADHLIGRLGSSRAAPASR
jgi:choline dehydrogenase-like flavoprotein